MRCVDSRFNAARAKIVGANHGVTPAAQYSGGRLHYPILSDTQLATRWKLSVATPQRWSAEGVGPPAWRIGKHPRYLEIEVDAFERQAQIRPKSDAGQSLSQSSPQAREDAIKHTARLWPAPRDLVLLSDDIVADVTGLPIH